MYFLIGSCQLELRDFAKAHDAFNNAIQVSTIQLSSYSQSFNFDGFAMTVYWQPFVALFEGRSDKLTHETTNCACTCDLGNNKQLHNVTDDVANDVYIVTIYIIRALRDCVTLLSPGGQEDGERVLLARCD